MVGDRETVVLLVDGFEVGYVTEDGARHRVPLAEAWAARFEAAVPARRFHARKGQRHLSGRWWSGTDGVHVGYESWLERDHVVEPSWTQFHVVYRTGSRHPLDTGAAGKAILTGRRGDYTAVSTTGEPPPSADPHRLFQGRNLTFEYVRTGGRVSAERSLRNAMSVVIGAARRSPPPARSDPTVDCLDSVLRLLLSCSFCSHGDAVGMRLHAVRVEVRGCSLLVQRDECWAY